MACARLLGDIFARNVLGVARIEGSVATRWIHIIQPSILKNHNHPNHRMSTQIVDSKMASEPFNGLKPLVTFVLGGPGSGKGTQCKLICDEFGYKHLSAGDLLRAERNSPGSKFGELIEKHIQGGTIVPVEITCSLLERAMLEHCQMIADTMKKETESKTNGDKLDDASSQLRGKFLIDGFPRNEDNLQGWTKQMAGKVGVTFVLFLDCPHDVCIKRCLERGQQGSNRSDDNEESLKKRLVTYTNDTMPIVHYYEKLNILKKVDATRSPQEVYAEVRKLFL